MIFLIKLTIYMIFHLILHSIKSIRILLFLIKVYFKLITNFQFHDHSNAKSFPFFHKIVQILFVLTYLLIAITSTIYTINQIHIHFLLPLSTSYQNTFLLLFFSKYSKINEKFPPHGGISLIHSNTNELSPFPSPKPIVEIKERFSL